MANKRVMLYGGYSNEALIRVAEALSDEVMAQYNYGAKSAATHVVARLDQVWRECAARGIHPADPTAVGYCRVWLDRNGNPLL